jgi:predicted ribosome quality control (RQC) complex YloA/Tae2 family protein
MFDSLTAAALTDELGRTIDGGRVQHVGHIDPSTVWLEIYRNRRRFYLIASADHSAPAVYLTDREPVWDRQWVSPFLLLLRKYARGSRVVAIQNPPLERIILLTFAHKLHVVERGEEQPIEPVVSESVDATEDQDDDDEDEAVVDDRIFTHLHIEIMGRHSNLILVNDEGKIMESVRRVTTSMSRVRPIAPKIAFTPPPVQIKDDPRRATVGNIETTIGHLQSERDVIRALTTGFRGLSPQIAREALFRANQTEAVANESAAVARELRRLYEPLITNEWAPRTYQDEDGIVVAYDAQEMTHLQGRYAESSVETISEAIRSAELLQQETGSGRHALRARKLQDSIATATGRLDARLSSLDAEVARHQNRDQLRQWGELIYGYLWQIKPGDRELVVDDLRIPLEPGIDPKELAKRYLEEYRDGKNSDSQIASARQTIELERSWQVQLAHMVSQAENIQDIEDLEAEWAAHVGPTRIQPKQRRSSPPKRTIPVTAVNGNPIYVGRSSSENDRVTFDIARPDDTWLHARGVPGSHVIVRWLGTPPDDSDTLQEAAAMAAWYSQSRTSARVEVDITARLNVRKIKGAGPGMVTYRNERTVLVSPSDGDTT